MAREFDLTNLPDAMLPDATQLPGDLGLIAQLVGVRAALILEKHLRGTHVYVRNMDHMRRELRDKWVRFEYDARTSLGHRGVVPALARESGLGERQIRAVLGQAGDEADDRQMKLFE